MKTQVVANLYLSRPRTIHQDNTITHFRQPVFVQIRKVLTRFVEPVGHGKHQHTVGLQKCCRAFRNASCNGRSDVLDDFAGQ